MQKKRHVDGHMHQGAFITGTGERVVRLHPESPKCWEHGCVIHAPSVHPMRNFPTHWRGDRGMMERICPHGVGHPDPDQVAYWVRTLGEEAAKTQASHGCDGCCAGAPLDEPVT